MSSGYWPDGDVVEKPGDITFLFQVVFGSLEIGDFQTVENIQKSVEVYSYQEGGRNHSPLLLPGPAKYGELTLKWGFMDRTTLWEWIEAVQIGGDFKRDIMIVHLTRRLMPHRIYTLTGAWPIEWSGANLDVNDNKIPVESIKLVYDSLSLEAIPTKLSDIVATTIST